jgi:Ras-related protein Rab-2A
MTESLQVSSFPTFKFVIIGDPGVGKSCLVSRFHADRFTATHEITVGVSFSTHTMRLGNKQFKVQLWDTAGQEIYRSMTRNYFRDADCAIVVCDLSKLNTFESLNDWIGDVRTDAPVDCKIVIAGNKSDLDREVTTEQIRTFCEEAGYPMFETSARTGANVQDLFEEAATLVLSNCTKEGSETFCSLSESTPTSTTENCC